MLKKHFAAAFFVAIPATLVTLASFAAEWTPAPGATLETRLLDSLIARPIGPARMGGRIVDIAVIENRPKQMYVASASGGLWKTVNNGTTWTAVFDEQNTSSLGCVAVSGVNPDVVWVGTGEANPRNSVSWGDGVYQSTDGGKTWQHRGLSESAHIGRIVIHPNNPDLVYVAALGRLWGPNKERGLYKTLDGGQSWRQVKFIDENTGFIDLVMDLENPATLYAAAYEVRRDAFAGPNPKVQVGPGAGLYKSTDGGETWFRMTKGLPDRPLGRCGLAVSRTDSRIVYAVVQTDKTDTRALSGQEARRGGKTETGGVFRSTDKGETWTKLNDLCPRPFYYGKIRIDPSDDQRVYVLGISLHTSADGGRIFRSNGAPGVHPDHHALWIDPRDPSHLILGGDGGLSFSYDRGKTWELVHNLPIGQFYAVAVDWRKPYHVYGGLQDNGTWGGPSATYYADGIHADDWQLVLGGDGFSCQVDPRDPETVYAQGQYGGLQRVNVRTGVSSSIRPRPASEAPDYRFNWNAPLLLSPHNSTLLYYGGNYLFRSIDRGDHWDVISPDLSKGRPGSNASTGHTITTIAESPLQSGLLYVGTDDGRGHVRRGPGDAWTDVSDNIPDVPSGRWITRIECSHFAPGAAYLTIDRHRQDDRKPYVFRTSDYGATWEALGASPRAAHKLPEGPVYVVREDPRNQKLLFVGTEVGLFVSLDAGAGWYRLKNGLPSVAVHDLVIHPRDRDLVVATHGRSLFVMDIGPLEEMTPEVLSASAYLFDIKPAVLFHYGRSRGYQGAKLYTAPNPPYGATIHYYLKTAAREPVQITITDPPGHIIAKLKGTQEAGLHRVHWRLDHGERDDEPGPYGPLVAPGDYVVKLRVGRQVLAKTVRVEADK
jgi:photosystem II stability/assembly factor-like uncharacterized protein